MVNCPQCGSELLPGDEVCSVCLSATHEIGLPDQLEGAQHRLMEEPIKNLNPAKPYSVESKDTLHDALQLMKEKSLGCVLVLSQKQLVGIFTERDALQKLANRQVNLKKETLKNYMTPNPEHLSPNHSIAYALNKMSVGGYRHLPVIHQNELTGIVSVRDILNYFWS